jgi:hypothetical protein
VPSRSASWTASPYSGRADRGATAPRVLARAAAGARRPRGAQSRRLRQAPPLARARVARAAAARL